MIDSVGLMHQHRGGDAVPTGLPSLRVTPHGTVAGRVENLSVIYSKQRTWLVGSLPRFLNGDNRGTASRGQIRAAVEKLSKSCNFDAGQSRVYRLDLAATLEVRRPVGVFVSRAVGWRRGKRCQFGDESVSFRRAESWLTLYDKSREMGGKNPDAPPLLRCEFRMSKRVSAQTGGRAVFLKDLYEEGFFARLIRVWERQALAVGWDTWADTADSAGGDEVSPAAFESVRTLLDWLAGLAAKKIGKAKLEALIGGAAANRLTRSRLKKRVSGLFEGAGSQCAGIGIATEFALAVRQVVARVDTD